MSVNSKLNRNRRDLNVNSEAIALMNVDDVKMRRERAEYVGRTMFDFKVGDEVELNKSAPGCMWDYFRGTIVHTGETGVHRIVPDMGCPYDYKLMHGQMLRPVVKP